MVPSSPEPRVQPDHHPRWHWAITTVAAVVLFLSGIGLPYPPTPDLDPSWQTVLAYAYTQPWQFGRDIVFTAGPWGWLRCVHATPDAIGLRFAWELVYQGVVTALVILTGLRLGVVRRLLLWSSVLLFGTVFPDTMPLLVITIMIARLIQAPSPPAWLTVTGLIILGQLALMKMTFLLLIFGGIGLVTISHLWRREFLRAAWIPALGAVALVLWWIAAGQNPLGLMRFIRLGLEGARGYDQAMAAAEPSAVFLAGLALWPLNLWWATRLARDCADRRTGWPLVVLLMATWFLSWKHGFTRADGHVMIWFIFSGLVALAGPALRITASRARFGGNDLIPPVALVGLFVFDASLVQQTPTWARHRTTGNARAIVQPGRWLSDFRAASDSQTSHHRNAALVELVGTSTVDTINANQGEVIQSGLNYQPRPVFQSYAAYTEVLLHLNLSHLRSKSAAEFMMVRLNTIDGRHPMLDDSLVLADLPRLYTLAHQANDWLLFRRTEGPVPESAGEVVRPRHRVNFGDTIPFDFATDRAIWLKAWALPSRLGRARATLYRPSMLFMTVTDDTGREERFRVIAPMMETGFIVHPVITSEADFAALCRGEIYRTVRSIRFETEHPDHAEFWAGIDIELVKVPHLPTKPTEPWGEFVRTGISNIAPERAVSDTITLFVPRPDGTAFLLHPIGELVFPVGSARRLSAKIGITEGAYTGEARTDGVDFVILAQAPDGVRTELWRRTLTPLERAEDRGALPLELEIPAGAEKLILQTWPGAAGNSGWDWSFWQAIRIE